MNGYLKEGDWLVLDSEPSSKGVIVGVEKTVFGARYRVEWRTGLCTGDTTLIDPEKVSQWMNPPVEAGS